MTRRTPSAEHAKPERDTGRVSVVSVQTGSVRPVVHESHGESPSALTLKVSLLP